MYVGGSFSLAGTISANNIAKWNGSHWFSLGFGLNGAVNAISSFGNHLYVGGEFKQAGEIDAKNIAKWNGENWSNLGVGIAGSVYALHSMGNELFIGGDFKQAGGIQTNNIAKWNGENWSVLGEGIPNFIVTSFSSIENDLFVGCSGMDELIWKWNGTWKGFGQFKNGGIVRSLTNDGQNLYFGVMERENRKWVARLMQFDGKTQYFSIISKAAKSEIFSVIWIDEELYVGGVNWIVKWKNSVLTEVVPSVDSFVRSLAFSATTRILYVGGDFINFNGTIVNHISQIQL